MFADGGVSYSYGVTQDDINNYVEKAKTRENTEDYKKYAEVSERLVSDVKEDIDLSDYSHALRDNDIRHIFNSHGEKTNEKYPVTEQDIESIPYIVENYDKVFYKTNNKNQPGIVYVKVGNDNVVYYVEAITEKYGSEKLLINKQMIKAGIDKIPKLYGLINAITKKQTENEFLSDLLQIRKAYARSEYQKQSVDNSISNPTENVNSKTKNSERDSKYLSLAKDPEKNSSQLQAMVDEAARENGYTSSMYHGSKKSADIKVFRDWQYFTENEKYAQRYADKKLYKVFVKASKWFDTRNTDDLSVFNEARQEYGLSEIGQRGLPDWTDGYDLSEFIDENGLDYDGIILDEGGDMVNGKPVYRGESYVVRKSAQIKSADPVTYDDNGNVIPLSERFNENNDDIRYSLRDSAGNTLSKQQQEYFKDSKVRDDDGNLLVVYHGTDSEFTVFDKTKGRANMDIQGSFFSPWELDASGYGSNVSSYYLNIVNPAPEAVAYKALNRFKGQNGAGIKAREYLESLGYDGVNNGDEEYIAFNSNQIKLVNNAEPTSNDDIRYALRDNYSKALTSDEWKKYNNAMTSGVDAGLRINDHSMLVECEKGDYSYKLVIYDNTFEENPIKAVYGIGNDDYSSTTIHDVAGIITDMEDKGYGKKYASQILRSTSKMYKIILGNYNSGGFKIFGESSNSNTSRTNTRNQSNGAGVFGTNQETVKYALRDSYEDTETLARDIKKELNSSLTSEEMTSYSNYINNRVQMLIKTVLIQKNNLFYKLIP